MRIILPFSFNRVFKLASSIAGIFILMPSAHGEMTPEATVLTNIGGIPITNSMVTSWVLSALIILLIRYLVKKPQLIPTRGQFMVETLVEGVKGLIEPIVGKRLLKPVFPLMIGFFTFILLQNWSGLFPGVGTIGYLDDHGHFQSYIRPANADLNMTLALTVIHFGAWIYFVMRYAGPKMLIVDLFGNKADRSDTPAVMFAVLTVIFFFVGIIEVVSIAFRNVSLPFRLYGNVFGGENLLHEMTGLAGWFVPVPFYFLEVLVGFVQALVFVTLVSVYIGLICNHDSEEHAH